MAETISLKVEGMTCGHCSMSVAKALKGVRGVSDANVDLKLKEAKVTYDPAKASINDLKRAVGDAGYEAS